jgi:hypothetical protein
VLGTPPKAPKLKALAKNTKVALTIDDNNFPHKVLLVRGTAHLETVKGIVPEYALAAERYFGREQGQEWVKQLRSTTPAMVRVAITLVWVGILDFQTHAFLERLSGRNPLSFRCKLYRTRSLWLPAAKQQIPRAKCHASE